VCSIHARALSTITVDNLATMPPPDVTEDGCRLGILAFGDSITNGGGEIQWGVALQSWALWTARGLGLPYTPYAVDGAVAGDVCERQIPAFSRWNATVDARYQLGCVYAGTNDIRRPDWDPERFAGQMETAMAFLSARCDRTLTLTIPLDLGRPRAGARTVEEANRAIEGAAARHGALVLDLRQFGGRNTIMIDHVHPTAFGQIAIAERALALLERDGMTIKVHPSQLISYSSTWGQRLRSDLTYARRHTVANVRAWSYARRHSS
jgi:lysophospholipase L1-like esterase